MEQNFYKDDFEHFLKETTDNFRLYPSKKVWTSIYNDLHPSRKWPSLAISLVLLSSMLFIGVVHKNDVLDQKLDPKAAALRSGDHPLISQPETTPAVLIASVARDKKTVSGYQPAVTNENPGNGFNSHTGITAISIPATVNNEHVVALRQGVSKDNNDLSAPVSQGQQKAHHGSQTKQFGINPSGTIGAKTIASIHGDDLLATDENAINSLTDIAEPKQGNVFLHGSFRNYDKRLNLPGTATIKKIGNITIASINLLTREKITEKEWMEDYVFHNQSSPSFKSKLEYQLYLTPSVGYRTLSKNVSYDLPQPPSAVASSQARTRSTPFIHSPALNLEAGYGLMYSYSKSVRIKAGVQLNYTNYFIKAHDLGHTTLTTLLLNDPYSGGVQLDQRSSSLANLSPEESERRLSNNSYQVSIPLGADIKLAGKNKQVQWFAGATLQPTYVLFGNAYLISSDANNYVYDADMIRKWNVNAGVETFISYRTKEGVRFNVGPQFRYQLLSTYDKKYSYNERLYNLGIKLGMTRNF